MKFMFIFFLIFSYWMCLIDLVDVVSVFFVGIYLVDVVIVGGGFVGFWIVIIFK